MLSTFHSKKFKSEHARQHVAAKRRGDKQLLVYRSDYKSQQHIVVTRRKKEKNIAVTNRFVYTGEFCLRDQIFSLHKYEILCDLLQRQKFCNGDNDFPTNSPVRNDLSLKDVAATYRLVWSDL